MRITKEEIRAAVAQFMRQATTYEVDRELGISDREDSYRQMVEVVVTALITDPNVLFGLMRVGVVSISKRFSEVLTYIEGIDALFPSLFENSRPDPINDKEMSKLDDALFAAAINPTGVSLESLQEVMKETSQQLGFSLPKSDGVNDTPIEARRMIKEHVLSLDERMKLLVADFDSLVRGLNEFDALGLSQTVLAKAVGAVENLFYDMRVERIEYDEKKADLARRERFIQLEAARSTLQVLNSLPNNYEYRIRTGISPSGRDIVFSAKADKERMLESISTKSGGYAIGTGDTLVVSTDEGTAPVVTFPKTEDPTLLSRAAPISPTTDKYLHILAGYKTMSLGPYTATPSSLAYPHAEFTVLGGSPSFVGHYCTLRYIGTAQDDTTAAIEVQLYKVVRYRNPGSPTVELDPPLPKTAIPVGWELTLLPLTGSWSVPSFSSTSDLVNKINNPNVATQAWRVHTKLTGTVVGTFLPGERIYRTLPADKEAVVIYAQGNDVWIHGCSNAFSNAENAKGRSSGATITNMTVVVTGVADKDLNAGQPNIARMVMASVYQTDKLKLEAKTLLGVGIKASITGGTLTLNIQPGEKGLWELGLWPDYSIYVDGTPYTINNITSNIQATVTPAAPFPVTDKMWFVTINDQLDIISALISGDRLDPVLLDTAGLLGYDPLAVFKLRTSPGVSGIADPAEELQMLLPQSDSLEWVSAAEVVLAIQDAQVPGLLAEEYRETIYDSGGAQLVFTVNSSVIDVTGELDDSLVGHFIVPDEGEHIGEDLLIKQDAASPRKLTVSRPARLSETITKFKVVAYRIRVYTRPRGVEAEITFGSGTAHAKLGFPVYEAITAMVKSGVFTEDKAEVDLRLLNVAEEDVIEVSRYALNIESIDGGVVTFSEDLPGSVQGADVAVPGRCPEEWIRFADEAEPLNQAWQAEEDPVSTLKSALGYITETNIKIQPEDVAPAKQAISDLKSSVSSSIAVLDSLNLPDVVQARNILRMLEERGYDNVTRMLTLGEFGEFLDSSVNTATLAGRIQDNIKGALGFLGKSSTPDEIEEDEATFVLAGDEPVELGDDMVGRKQFDLDDEEGEGEEIVESNEVYSGD